MVRYVERIEWGVRPYLQAGEVLLAATPAEVPAAAARVRPLASTGLRTVTPVATICPAPSMSFDLGVQGRIVIVCTDRRVLFFEQRRFRATPGRLIRALDLGQIGNIEGIHTSAHGTARLELVVILADGSASSIRIPAANADDGKEAIRRLQARLRAA